MNFVLYLDENFKVRTKEIISNVVILEKSFVLGFVFGGSRVTVVDMNNQLTFLEQYACASIVFDSNVLEAEHFTEKRFLSPVPTLVLNADNTSPLPLPDQTISISPTFEHELQHGFQVVSSEFNNFFSYSSNGIDHSINGVPRSGFTLNSNVKYGGNGAFITNTVNFGSFELICVSGDTHPSMVRMWMGALSDVYIPVDFVTGSLNTYEIVNNPLTYRNINTSDGYYFEKWVDQTGKRTSTFNDYQMVSSFHLKAVTAQ